MQRGDLNYIYSEEDDLPFHLHTQRLGKWILIPATCPYTNSQSHPF